MQRITTASPYEPTIGFCRALRIGARILVSGTAPIGTDGRTVSGDARAQAGRCLEIIVQAVESLGGAAPDVIRTRAYLTHREDWEAVGAAHGEVFSGVRPVATMVVVAGLLDPDWRVEMEAEALIPDSLRLRAPSTEDRAWIRQRSTELFGGDVVISRGLAHEPAALEARIALRAGERVGLITWRVADGACEVVTVDAWPPHQGTGTALMAAAEAAARAAGCPRIWLITTNDNLDALRFYQRRGYRIAAVHPDAIRESRRLKPQIPELGAYGIPIRDEIELEKAL